MVSIALLIQLSLTLVLHLYHTREFESDINRRLSRRVAAIAAQLQPRLPAISDEQVVATAESDELRVFADRFGVSVMESSGETVAPRHSPGLAVDPDALRDVPADGAGVVLRLKPADIRSTSIQNGSVRRGFARVISPDGRAYIVAMEISDEYTEQMVAMLARNLLLSVPIGVVATWVSAYFIAGLAIRPLSSLTEAAKQLSPESINRRLDVPAESSEVASVRAELEAARKRIEKGFAAQERFMSNVSHELKTPITTILTELQTLPLDGASGPVRTFLKSQGEELVRLAHTVDSFLLLTRVRHSKGEVPHSARCLLREVLVEAYASSAAVARQYGVQIDLQLPEGEQADIAVIGNSDLLKTIFDNILRNAVRFSPTGTSITVRTAVRDQRVDISIRDRGAGIAADLLPRIFDRFAQSKEEERRGRGHGLGLEIALGIAELHGGTISVQNCPDGAGCEFTVHLPIAPREPT